MWPLHTKARTKHHVSLWTLWMLQSNSVPVSLTCPWTVWMYSRASSSGCMRTGSWSFSVASVCTAGPLEDHTPAHRQYVWPCVEDVKAANSSAVTQRSLQRPSTAAHTQAFTINYRLCASALHVSPKTMHHLYTTSLSEKHQWIREDQIKKRVELYPCCRNPAGLRSKLVRQGTARLSCFYGRYVTHGAKCDRVHSGGPGWLGGRSYTLFFRQALSPKHIIEYEIYMFKKKKWLLY